ncbi:SRPBCC family protein [Brachybacterium vulturis]|uniref:SRPBCC family protein n=1 Tax=Brachybacterium vulturis TaxID=2017484 RepID=UPI0012FDF596|nr:SRPBCC family protein [Brachybacterium vulturis]
MTPPEPLLRRGAHHHAVELERTLGHPVDQVWRAVTVSELLSRWFPGAPQFELRTGGRARFPAFAGLPAEFGEVLECEAPQLLRFSWGTDEMRIVLDPVGESTRLTIVHGFTDLPGAASFATGWEACLEGLDAVLDGREVANPGPRRARHEQLADRFGLDEPELEEGAEGWTVRFARQLVCPAETAWHLFVNGGDRLVEEPPVLVVGEALHAPQAPSVVLGHLTEVDAPTLLAFDTADGEPGDHVRLELRPGTGHGTRLVLTVSGQVAEDREAAAAQWGQGAVRPLAAAALAHAADGG